MTEILAIRIDRSPKISVASMGEEEAATHELLPWSVSLLALTTLDSKSTILDKRPLLYIIKNHIARC